MKNETNYSAEQANLDKSVEQAVAEEYPDANEAKNQADATCFKPEAEEGQNPTIPSTGTEQPGSSNKEGKQSSDPTKVLDGQTTIQMNPTTVAIAVNPSQSASSETACAETQDALPTGHTSAAPAGMPVDGPSVVPVTCSAVNGANMLPLPSVQPSGLAGRLQARMAASASLEIVVNGGKTPTDEQRAVLAKTLEIVKAGDDSAMMIEAGAGTGKTSTLRMLADILPGNGQYTAFNRALVNESAVKFHGTKVDCKTTHQLAFRAVGYKYADRLNGPRIRSERVAQMLGIKMFSIQRTTIDEATGEQSTKPHNLAPGFLAGQVMGAIRKFSQSADKEVLASHFKYIDGIDLPAADGRRTYTCNNQAREYLLPFAQKAWQDLCNPEGQLPFTHDHYVKMWELDNPVISASYVMLDECQDTAEVMLSILSQQRIPKILVGDSAQAIYEWRGAVNAMQAFPGAPRLFLSQSFRFGQPIADVANAVLETLEEATPLRLKGFDKINSVVAPMTEYKAVLCRTNAVAVGRLLAAIADGKAPFLVGGGADVIAFVKAAKDLQQGVPTNHPELACFESWPGVQAYVKEDEGEDLKLLVNLIDAFGCDPIISALENMPAEKDADLIISTAHKSKGREWDSVKIERDFPTLSKSDDAAKKLLYVAVTRAKLALDISECPFFTGQDALDLSDIIKPADYTPIVAPAPSKPPTTGFSWSKDKKTDKWIVRGPNGADNTEVEVFRKDGSSAKVKLGQAIHDGDGYSLYVTRRY